MLKNRTLLQQTTWQSGRDVTPNVSNSGTSLIIPTHSQHVPTPLPLSLELSNPSGMSSLNADQGFLHHDSISRFDGISDISSLTPIDPVQGCLDHNDHDQWPLHGYQDPPSYHEDDQGFDDLAYDYEDTGIGPGLLEHNEDDPDPFVVEREKRQTTPSFKDIPGYLLVIYATVSWLHLQFYLPRVACNALLAIIARIITFLDPVITLPFITLISATRSLGVESQIELLAVCPNCRDVYPSASSKHAQDTCTICNVPLFLPDLTKRGNRRAAKTPVIKCPYLSLLNQLESLLKVPGVEALLDEWRQKPRQSGHYTDIFDGKVCRLDLKAPDGCLFFRIFHIRKMALMGNCGSG